MMKFFKRPGPTVGIGLLLLCLTLAQLAASPKPPYVTTSQAWYSKPDSETISNLGELQQTNPFQDLTATLQRLRDEYARIVAKFNALSFECKSNLRIRVDEAIAEAIKWKRSVDSFGLLETIDLSDMSATEKELIIRDRFATQGLTGEALDARVRAFNLNDLVGITAAESQMIRMHRLRQRGLTERQIADILRGEEAIVRELRPMYENLDRLIWESLKKAYNKAYQCCLCSALEFYPSMMQALFQELTLISETEAVRVGSIEKNQECARAVQEKWSGGGGWRGIITYTSKYNYKTSGQKANNISYEEWDSTYEATFHLDGKKDEHGAPLARVRATATDTSKRGSRGTDPCYRISQQLQEVAGSAESAGALVTVSANPRAGTYFVSYAFPEVIAKGTNHVSSKVAGTCNNPFNKSVDYTQAVTDFPVESGPGVEIEGTLDPNNAESLVGYKTTTVRGRHGGTKTLTVSWDLTYCKQP
jgi:hypothetical protein